MGEDLLLLTNCSRSPQAVAVVCERRIKLGSLHLDTSFSLWDLCGFRGVEQKGFLLRLELFIWNSDDFSVWDTFSSSVSASVTASDRRLRSGVDSLLSPAEL